MFDLRPIYISVELTTAVLWTLYSSVLLLSNDDGENSQTVIKMLMCNTVLLLSDAVAWYLRGADTYLSWWLVRISNFILFECNYAMLILFTDFIDHLTESHGTWKKAAIGIGILGVILIVILQFANLIYFFDAENFYHRTSLYWLTSVIGLKILLIDIRQIVEKRSSLSRSMFNMCLIYAFLPLAALLIQTLIYGFSLSNAASAIAATLLAVVAEANYARKNRENYECLHKQDIELHDLQNRMIISQVQPHFLFKSLNAIYCLIQKDLKQAKTAVDRFLTYLRVNVLAPGDTRMVPFSKEFEIIGSYLNPEHMRFGDEMKVMQYYKAVDFEVLPMIIQPLVENAANHGIKKRENGGTAKITSSETKHEYLIAVKDDGVGFNPDDPPINESNHVGMCRVKERIRYMCKGTADVISSLKRLSNRQAEDGNIVAEVHHASSFECHAQTDQRVDCDRQASLLWTALLLKHHCVLSKGPGAALMEYAMKQFENLPLYLENSTSMRNNAFYNK